MSVEYLGEKIFREEIAAAGQVWVAKNAHQGIYAMDLDRAGLSLPVWSSSEKAGDYLRNARLIGPPYQPHAIPLAEFSGAWLSDWSKGIAELQINPDGRSSRVLVLTTAEFLAPEATPG